MKKSGAKSVGCGVATSKAIETTFDDRICAAEGCPPRWEHITLRCRRHPELRWSTKNISHIGARSIFYDWRPDAPPECPCPISQLEHVHSAA